MASAWGNSWGSAWGDSWGTISTAVTKAPFRVGIASDPIIKRHRPLPWWLEPARQEKKIVAKVAKKIEASEPNTVAAEMVARVEGILLAEQPGLAALAKAASRAHEYDPEEVKRIRAYWDEVERMVIDMIDEEEILWLLN